MIVCVYDDCCLNIRDGTITSSNGQPFTIKPTSLTEINIYRGGPSSVLIDSGDVTVTHGHVATGNRTYMACGPGSIAHVNGNVYTHGSPTATINNNNHSSYMACGPGSIARIDGIVYVNYNTQVGTMTLTTPYTLESREHVCSCPITTINVKGGAVVTVQTPNLLSHMNISGAGNVVMHKHDTPVYTLDIKISGAGTVDMGGQVARSLNIKVSGSGHVYGFVVTGDISAYVSGCGGIVGKALPGTTITKRTSGCGSIDISV